MLIPMYKSSPCTDFSERHLLSKLKSPTLFNLYLLETWFIPLFILIGIFPSLPYLFRHIVQNFIQYSKWSCIIELSKDIIILATLFSDSFLIIPSIIPQQEVYFFHLWCTLSAFLIELTYSSKISFLLSFASSHQHWFKVKDFASLFINLQSPSLEKTKHLIKEGSCSLTVRKFFLILT